MTHYFDAWLESLAARDATIEKMFWMGVSLVLTWLLFHWLERKGLLFSKKVNGWIMSAMLWGGQALYWGTIIYTWIES